MFHISEVAQRATTRIILTTLLEWSSIITGIIQKSPSRICIAHKLKVEVTISKISKVSELNVTHEKINNPIKVLNSQQTPKLTIEQSFFA